MRTTKFILIVLFFSSLASYGLSSEIITTTNPPKWILLGQKTVSKITDHDEIKVTIPNKTFRKLKLKVTKSPIYVINVKVVYANGTSENHIINKRINKGRFSKVLDLKGNKRIIKKIIFNYRTKLLANGNAIVTAFGKR